MKGFRGVYIASWWVQDCKDPIQHAAHHSNKLLFYLCQNGARFSPTEGVVCITYASVLPHVIVVDREFCCKVKPTMLRGYEQRRNAGESNQFLISWIRTTMTQRSIQEDETEEAADKDNDKVGLAFFLSVGLMGLIVFIWCVACCYQCNKGPSAPPPPPNVRGNQVAPATHHSKKTQKAKKKHSAKKHHNHHHHHETKSKEEHSTTTASSTPKLMEDKTDHSGNTQSGHAFR